MAKKKNGGKSGGRGNNNHFPGRPSGCENPPGETACLKRLKGPKNSRCRNCFSPKILSIKIKVFGR